METNKSIGLRIKNIRISLGLTMEEFGLKFNPVANKSLVSKWESGKSLPNNERLKLIAEIGNTSVKFLLTGIQDDMYSPSKILEILKEMGSQQPGPISEDHHYSKELISTKFNNDALDSLSLLRSFGKLSKEKEKLLEAVTRITDSEFDTLNSKYYDDLSKIMNSLSSTDKNKEKKKIEIKEATDNLLNLL